MNETTINNEVKTNQQLWKIELEDLRKQKGNKSLPATVQKLIEDQIIKLEERIGKFDEYTGLLGKINHQVERFTHKLNDLKKRQQEYQTFLGLNTPETVKPSKMNVDDVIAFIKKSGGTVSISQLATHTGMSRMKVKKSIEKHLSFKIDTTAFPHKVTVK